MASFLAELKRRHIYKYKVAAAYAVVVWVLPQIVNNVTPVMQAPAWVGQFCLLLLVLGYWRARGWPDLCRPMGADDLVCD